MFKKIDYEFKIKSAEFPKFWKMNGFVLEYI